MFKDKEEELQTFSQAFVQAQPQMKIEVPKTWKELAWIYETYRLMASRDENNICTIHPRFVSPNSLTPRFQAVDGSGSFKLIGLPVHDKFHDALKQILQEPGKFYYEGPQGIGKSFTLVEGVLFLRQMPNLFRVIYVNNPELWRANPIQYILNEIIWAFMPDLDTFPRADEADKSKGPLEQWYDKLKGSNNKKDDFQLFFEKAADYCSSNGFRIVSFLDQENSISDLRIHSNSDINAEYIYPFPFSYYQTFPSANVNVSFASANNKTHTKRTEGWVDLATYFKASIKEFAFPTETAQKIIRNHLSAWKTLPKEKIPLLSEEIIDLTGGNSNELMLLLANCTAKPDSYANLRQKIRDYFEGRFKTLLNEHEKFAADHIVSGSQDYFYAISYTDTGYKLPIGLHKAFDKKILYLEGGRLISLFPLAKTIVYTILANKGLDNAVENLVSQYLDFDVGGEGYLLEFYIIDSMKRMVQKNTWLEFSYKNLKLKQTGTKAFNIKACENLVGTPLQKPNQTTLYVPLSKSYPDIDCLIYDADDDKLFPIQITKTQKNHKDSYTTWEKGAQKKWLDVFQNCQVSFIWLVGLPKKYTTKNQNYWVVTFESLPEYNKQYFRQFSENKEKLNNLLRRIDEVATECEETFIGVIEDTSTEF